MTAFLWALGGLAAFLVIRTTFIRHRRRQARRRLSVHIGANTSALQRGLAQAAKAQQLLERIDDKQLWGRMREGK
jgi:hypothetical protein